MAANFDNLGDNLKTAAAEAGLNDNNAQAGFSQDGVFQGAGIKSFTDSISMPFSRQFTSEQVTQLRDKMEERLGELFKQSNELKNKIKIAVFDKSNSGIGAVSSVVVFAVEKSGSKTQVAAYVIAIEATAPQLGVKTINWGGQQIQMIRTTGDLLNNDYRELIASSLKAQYQADDPEVTIAGDTVLYKEANIESNSTIDSLIINSVIAVTNNIRQSQGGVKFALSMFGQNETPIVSVKNDSGHVESVTGLPVRSDVLIRLGSRDEQGNENGLVTMDGYVDLTYAPMNNQQAMWGGPQQPVNGPSPTYMPRFIITRLDSEVANNTLSLQLLGLAQATLVNTNGQWKEVFYRPNSNVKGVDTKDIGAIGYEVPLYQDPAKLEALPTKGHDFDRNKFAALMNTYFHQGMLVSMDIDERGETSWLNSAFAIAASGDRNAIEAIIAKADELTAIPGTTDAQGKPVGRFSQLWNESNTNNSFIARNVGRVHQGYYLDEATGEKQDLRNLDYLAILNYSKGDKRLLERYDMTFNTQSGQPEAARLEERARIIQSVLNNVTFKGYAQRIEFNPDFIRCLSEACGYIRPIQPATNMQAGMNTTVTRGYADTQSMGLGANLGYGMLNNVQPQMPGQYNAFSGYGTYRY